MRIVLARLLFDVRQIYKRTRHIQTSFKRQVSLESTVTPYADVGPAAPVMHLVINSLVLLAHMFATYGAALCTH
jgi:hypothetical protein